jgi:hypothetical protein
VTTSRILKAEWLQRRHEQGKALLAQDPESLEGLPLTGEMTDGLANVLRFSGGTLSPERYQRLSEVLAAGEYAIRCRRHMGAKRWAEWLAFMASRGLEWGKPLTQATSLPAQPLPDQWNVYQFASGDNLARFLSGNSKIRHRLVALGREINCFQRHVETVTKETTELKSAFLAVQTGLSLVWEGLEKQNILSGNAS